MSARTSARTERAASIALTEAGLTSTRPTKADRGEKLFGVQLYRHEIAGAIEAAKAHAADAETRGRMALAMCRQARVAMLADCLRLSGKGANR